MHEERFVNSLETKHEQVVHPGIVECENQKVIIKQAKTVGSRDKEMLRCILILMIWEGVRGSCCGHFEDSEERQSIVVSTAVIYASFMFQGKM